MKAARGTYSKAIQNLEVDQEATFSGEVNRASVNVICSNTGKKMGRKFTVKTTETGIVVKRLA